MKREEAPAYIMSQVVCAMADIEGMKALNAERAAKGYAQAYDEAAFFAVPEKYGLHQNAVITFFDGFKY